VRIPDGRSFSGDAVVVAVGGHAGRLPIPGAELALTYEDVRRLTALPASVAVVGGADTGCQLASILADFGAQVTLVEASPRLVPHADQDISAALADGFHRRGITVLTATLVERLDRTAAGVAVQYRSGSEQARLEAEAVFFAVGWPGNADTLGADAVGIATTRAELGSAALPWRHSGQSCTSVGSGQLRAVLTEVVCFPSLAAVE
jgi:pyruvate/2-oxoglutarate dehydrogenase complex dihydrolipoamide dehydrogenase (E3) component